jgi:CubicO group peptidase (beta-lactamase class C family)
MIGVAMVMLLGGALTAAEPTDPALRGLRERWTEAMRALRVPGLAVVVVRGDEVTHLDALGVRDPAGPKPVTPDTYFYIASCTKPYVAAAAVRLAEAGKLDLDAPVQRYLPRFQLADADAAQKLTVRDLLTHRPGLNTFPVVFLDAFTGEITEDRYYHFLKLARPGGQVAYSNIHFTLAGRDSLRKGCSRRPA